MENVSSYLIRSMACQVITDNVCSFIFNWPWNTYIFYWKHILKMNCIKNDYCNLLLYIFHLSNVLNKFIFKRIKIVIIVSFKTGSSRLLVYKYYDNYCHYINTVKSYFGSHFGAYISRRKNILNRADLNSKG